MMWQLGNVGRTQRVVLSEQHLVGRDQAVNLARGYRATFCEMALFEFALASVDQIVPWESSDGPSLSWFALTDGTFRMPVGDEILFEYSDEILRHWCVSERTTCHQIAALARDILGSFSAGVAALPSRVERLASDEDLLRKLQRASKEICDASDTDAAHDLHYAAWRWLGERSPWASYLTANPDFHFLRIGDELRISWDNRNREVDGHRVWTAQLGVFSMPVQEFDEQCRGFAKRLLQEMERRIDDIERGAVTTRIPLDTRSLRDQQLSWNKELSSYFADYHPDINWEEAERALELVARESGLRF